MPHYRYTAIHNQNGKRVRGTVVANNAQDAKQVIPPHLQLVSLKASVPWARPRKHRLNSLQRAEWANQLKHLLEAGMPLTQCLATLASQPGHQANLMRELQMALLAGKSLSEAMLAFPQAFDTTMCASIAAGERGGLIAVLTQLSKHLHMQHRQRSQSQQALLYPLLMLAFASGVLVFLLLSVLPHLASTLQHNGQALPWSTQKLLAFSHHLARFGWLDGVVAIILSFGLSWLFRRVRSWQLAMQQCILKLPIVGRYYRDTHTCTFLRNLGTLLQSGTHLPQAMRLANQSNCLPMQTAIESAIEAVESGTTLDQALHNTGHHTPMSLQIIHCGSASGQLDRAVLQAAETLQWLQQKRSQRFITLIEPMTILLVGGMVLMVVMATLLPIFNLNDVAML